MSGGSAERAVVRPQLRRRGRAHLRIDRVDGSGAQTDGRDDRAVAGDVDLAGGEPQLLARSRRGRRGWPSGSRRRRSGDRSARRARSRWRWAGRTVSSGATGAAARAVTPSSSALPRVEGLPHPVRGPLGPDLHHEGVAQASPQGRVEAGGEAEIPADANPPGRGAGPRELRGHPGVAGEGPGHTDRAAAPGPRDEGDPGRHDGRREHEEDRGGGRRRCDQRQDHPRRGETPSTAGRGPHFGQAPQTAAGPRHDEEAEAEIDRQRAHPPP